jgi:hypothetical protein
MVVPLSQPIRPFIKEVMEIQHFPVRHYTPGGEIIKPYDITSWSLPLHRDIEAIEIEQQSPEINNNLTPLEFPFTLYKNSDKQFVSMIFSVNNNESFKAAFHAVQSGITVKRTTEDLRLTDKLFPKAVFGFYPLNLKNLTKC